MNEFRNQTLTQRHRSLDQRIHEEEHRPLPDAILIRSLKREKLSIKDALVAT